ncbi:MAG: DUF1295 domain-containing protein [Longimicrobiales bacterium]
MDLLLRMYGRLGLAVLLYVTTWYFVGRSRRRNDVADVAWGLGFLLIAVLSFIEGGGFGGGRQGAESVRTPLITLLVAIWSVRLSLHIYLRNRGKAEDARYAAWRSSWQRFFQLRAYLQIYVLQGFLMLVISAPVVIANTFRSSPVGWVEAVGVACWCVGFFFEVVGDHQLARFVRDPANRGRILESGLWRYSRHPNYFGEVLLWCGIGLIALPARLGWAGLVGPACIAFLILKVSGVPMLEEHLAKKAGFDSYKGRVNAFVPGRRSTAN